MIWVLCCLLISSSYLVHCDSGPTIVDPPRVDCTTFSAIADPISSPVLAQTRTVLFHKVLECRTPEVTGSSNFPSGVAVTPDGRWLVSLGFSNGTVTLYDATTLDIVAGPLHKIPVEIPVEGAVGDTIFLAQPHAVTISPDGSMAVLTSGNGVIGLALPSLDLLFNPLIPGLVQPRHVVRDRAGENYYISSGGSGIARLSATGEPQAFFEDAFITTAMSLTRDNRELLLVTDNGGRFVVLTAPDLQRRLSIKLPSDFEGQVVVPLKLDNRAIIVGGRKGGGETSVALPLMALSIDLTNGAMGSHQILFEGTGGFVLLGDGNEWTDVGEATAVVPTLVGTVTIDTNLGTVALHPPAELESNVLRPPCCDIAAYPSGDRVVFSVLDVVDNEGSLIVYEVEERVVVPH